MTDGCAFDQPADMTFAISCLFPFGEGLGQFLTIAAYLRQPLVQLTETLANDLAHLAAGALTGTLFRDDALDFVEREPQHLRALDKGEAIKHLRVVQSITAARAVRTIQQAALLVEPERLDARSAQLRYLANLDQRRSPFFIDGLRLIRRSHTDSPPLSKSCGY